MAKETVTINRAPVLTLWAAVVAERLGYRRAEALTLGKAVAGLNAQAKGRRLGIYKPGKDKGNNWLPAPADGFYLQLRMYQPGERMYNREYIVPPVARE